MHTPMKPQSLFTHLFKTHLLSTYCIPWIVLGAKDPEMTKMDIVPAPMEYTFWWGRQALYNKTNNQCDSRQQ